MAIKTINETPKNVQDMFHRGLGAFERNNLDYAIEMLLTCLDSEPNLLEVRKFVRAAEIKQFKQSGKGFAAHIMSTITCLPALARAFIKAKTGKALEALRICESLLRQDPLNLRFIRVFCIAAEAAGMPELVIQTLKIARDHYPENNNIIFRLGKSYMSTEQASEARECFDVVLQRRPDGAVRKAFKDAIALESIITDGWGATAEEKGDYRELLKDAEKAELLEKEAKAVRSESDTDVLIEQTLQKIEADPNNVNYYRTLANLYATNKRFDEAISTLQKAQEFQGVVDPEIDSALSVIRLNQFDHEIAKLTGAGDKAGADNLLNERNTFYFADIQERVHKYPNDLHLRYEFGAALYERGLFNDAVQQFQLSQKNPHWHVNSLYYMGLCFKAKGQYDLAIEQFRNAAAEIPTMDDTKKEILYELGLAEEEQNNPAKAAEYYKQIYQTDIGFKDVARKVEQIYNK